MVEQLLVRVDAGIAARLSQVAAGRAFASRYGLSPQGQRLVVAMCLNIPYERWGAFVGKDDNRKFNNFCSSSVFPRVGVSGQQNLLSRVLNFQQRWQARDEPLLSAFDAISRSA